MQVHRYMLLAMVLCAAVLVAGCGGSDDSNDGGSASDAAETRQVDDDDAPAMEKAELHESISNLPLPDGYKVPFPADVAPKERDERETVVQLIELTQTNVEVAEFFVKELPAAGFKILDKGGAGDIVSADDAVSGQAAMLHFENPEGLPGQISINPSPDSAAGTNLTINFYKGGNYS